MIISTKNSTGERKVSGSAIKALTLTLLVLITCTCSGPRLMLATRSSEKPTDYSTYSGKPVKQTKGVMECAILKIEDPDFPLWLRQRLLISPQFHQTHGMAYCPNLGRTLRKCSQIRSYQYPSIIRSFSNPYRMGWIDLRPNWLIVSPRPSSQGKSYSRTKGPRSSLGSIPR